MNEYKIYGRLTTAGEVQQRGLLNTSQHIEVFK